ncbi:MAG TPA: hypothetical protein VFA20_01760 [Myxococcaceae bacterium]|nr:hypothetical protein [Myxococcaceae bacterium]
MQDAARHDQAPAVSRTGSAPGRPDRLILLYDLNSGLGAMLLDAARKAVGREDCPLCEIAYSPIGKRKEWRACEARLGIKVEELYRDKLPPDWGIALEDLPVVLGRVGDERPFVIVNREGIVSCHGSVSALEEKLVAALGIGSDKSEKP